LSEEEACIRIGGDEFPEMCGPCDPTTCQHGSEIPSIDPTTTSSSAPSKSPSAKLTNSCGCDSCTESILNTLAGDHTCGSRINWLQSSAGGLLSEEEACIRIGGDEFPEMCGPCNPQSCT